MTMTKKQLNSFLGKEIKRQDDASTKRTGHVDLHGTLCVAIAGIESESRIVARGISREDRCEDECGKELGKRLEYADNGQIARAFQGVEGIGTQSSSEGVNENSGRIYAIFFLTSGRNCAMISSVESDGAFPKIRNRPEAAPRSRELTASSRAFFLAASARLTRGKGDVQDGC